MTGASVLGTCSPCTNSDGRYHAPRPKLPAHGGQVWRELQYSEGFQGFQVRVSATSCSVTQDRVIVTPRLREVSSNLPMAKFETLACFASGARSFGDTKSVGAVNRGCRNLPVDQFSLRPVCCPGRIHEVQEILCFAPKQKPGRRHNGGKAQYSVDSPMTKVLKIWSGCRR